MKAKLSKVMLLIYVLVFLTVVVSMALINQNYKKHNEYKASVVEVIANDFQGVGISNIGTQVVEVEILEGEYKGERYTAYNNMMGQADMDVVLEENDAVLIQLNMSPEGEVVSVFVVDLYRQGYLTMLFMIFVVLLLIYAKEVGAKALLSFVASLVIIWQFLIPELLKGEYILGIITLTIILITAIIVFSVAGFSKLGISSFIGTVLGVFAMLGLTLVFGESMRLLGYTAPYAESILYRGYFDVSMKEIFYGSIMLGASGAAMDIAMDVAASIKEIKEHKPDICFKKLFTSGLNVGRAVIGTMTTTLLLAYSGGYLTLMMFFQINESSLGKIMNMEIVAAEVMRILVGSIGLVLVAPLTAAIAAYIYSLEDREVEAKKE